MDYTVKKGDWLSKIALAHGFRDGGAAIWDANPKLHELTGGNPDVLQAGWVLTIPKPREKSVDVATGAKHTFKLRLQKKNLRVTLQDPDRTGLKGWSFTIREGEKELAKGSSAGDGHIDVKDVDQTMTKLELEVQDSTLFGLWKFDPEKIELQLGTLDPVAGEPEDQVIAVQKILNNLGHYTAKIDGKAGQKTRAALRSFQQVEGIQPVTGLADKQTCERLVKSQGNKMPKPAPANDSTDDKRDEAADPKLPGEISHGILGERVTTFSEYLEPTQDDQTQMSALGKFHFFPHHAHVAPCDPGREADNPNVVRMPARQFVFLDVGRWIGDKGERDFGLIWGRHVYLCRYDPAGGQTHRGKRPGLDTEFLEAMKGHVEIVKWASAAWAPLSDFNWDKLIVVLPDMHLMTSAKADIWFYANEPQGSYRLGAEDHLGSFVELLTNESLKSKVQVVHIGDSYDLWVGYESCIYTKEDLEQSRLLTQVRGLTSAAVRQKVLNPAQTAQKLWSDRTAEMVGDQDRVRKVCAWIREIQGRDDSDWVNRVRGKQGSEPAPNPAVEAFEALEKAFVADVGMIYIYGNHDDYLSLDPITAAAGIAKRRRFLELPGIFIEHAHRMEARFWGPSFDLLPHNYNGDPSGYRVTNELYDSYKSTRSMYLRGLTIPERVYEATVGKVASGAKEIAGGWAMIRDQPAYWGEQAQVWLGRQSEGKLKPPHIFVIGHTHLPQLRYVDISAFRR